MTKTRWIIFTAITILLFGALIIYSRDNRTTIDVSSVDPNSIVDASEQNGNIGDRVYNDTKSDLVFIEYADYQCPGCASAQPGVEQLMEKYGDKIAIVFRHFPIISAHPNALAAAAAAEAAGAQGKFWQMNATLFENQSQWQANNIAERTDTFKGYAEAIGLDINKFVNDLSSADISQKINFDMALARKKGVNATPTFYFDGEKLSDEATKGILQGDLSAVSELIDSKL
ncbi:hypothetical protein B7Y94_00785 [Candidatus Saccharibacteria bacterium 32-49-12]|nr:MAG: hypothetical protein B7Y94_00785 [Candidatus Saccharibacteria bacterium 32-49-12]